MVNAFICCCFHFLCFIGAHAWCYAEEKDAVGRSIGRACLRCPAKQRREYDGLSFGGFGPWVSER